MANTEESYTEEYISTGENLRFEPPGQSGSHLDEPSCAICSEPFSEVKNFRTLMSTPCGHVFCEPCLCLAEKSIKTTRSGQVRALECPTCRKSVLCKDCHPIYL